MTTSIMFRLPEVIRRTGLSRATIYRLQAAGEFPRAVKLGPRASGWRSDELDTWLTCRPRSR